MRSPRRVAAALAALAAAALTVAALLGVLPLGRWSEPALMLGLVLAAAPFGGLYGGPPVVPVVLLACLVNAVIWAGAAAGVTDLVTGARAARAAARRSSPPGT